MINRTLTLDFFFPTQKKDLKKKSRSVYSPYWRRIRPRAIHISSLEIQKAISVFYLWIWLNFALCAGFRQRHWSCKAMLDRTNIGFFGFLDVYDAFYNFPCFSSYSHNFIISRLLSYNRCLLTLFHSACFLVYLSVCLS